MIVKPETLKFASSPADCGSCRIGRPARELFSVRAFLYRL